MEEKDEQSKIYFRDVIPYLAYFAKTQEDPQYQKEKSNAVFNRRWFFSTIIIAFLCFFLAAIVPSLLTGIIALGIYCGLMLTFGIFFAARTAPYRVKKQLIINNGPLINIANEEDQKPLTCSNAICSQMYYEGKNPQVKNAIQKPFQNQIDACSSYGKTPLIAPLLAVIALATLGKSGNPPLKTILSIRDNIKHLSHSSALGAISPASNPNTLFVSFQNDIQKTIPNGISTFFHEGAHFVAHLLMNNLANPYSRIDDEGEINYLSILENLNETKFDQWRNEANEDKKILEVIDSFENVYEYPKRWQACELFVQVAQTIAILGYEPGLKWLNSHIPELVSFWENHFNPACLHYLKHHHAEQYLALDETFINAINHNAYTHPSEKLSLPIYAWRSFRSFFSLATLVQFYVSLSKFPPALGIFLISLAVTTILLNVLMPASILLTMPALAITLQILLGTAVPFGFGLMGYYIAHPILNKLFEYTDVESADLLLLQEVSQTDVHNEEGTLPKEALYSKNPLQIHTPNKNKNNAVDVNYVNQPWRFLTL